MEYRMTSERGVIVAFFATCTGLAGCTSAVDVSTELQVRTARSEYYVGAPIEVRIENGTDEGVHVAHCNHRVSLMVQRRVGAEWENYRQTNGPLCLTIYPMGELHIEAGADLTETLQIDEAGEFRLQLGARRSHEDFGSTVVYSAAFRVRYPPD